MTQSLRSKGSNKTYDSLTAHKKRGNLYGKEKNEIMEENFNCSTHTFYNVYDKRCKKSNYFIKHR